jgi:hypothetical protein
MGRGAPGSSADRRTKGVSGLSGLRHYRFQSVWDLEAAPEVTYDVLRDIGTYTAWWPEIRDVWRIDDDTADVRARSFLPYDLRFTMTRSRDDRDAGVLEVSMVGELEGFSRFTITGVPTGSRVVFAEQVVTNKALLNWLAPIARPGFRFNHTLMMRHGLAGLKTYLAGFRRGAGS